MAFYPNEKIGIFIDGANLYSASRGLDFDIDYRKLLDEFRKRGRLMCANYYTALLENEDYTPLRPLVDWLAYNGFNVITKPAKEYTDDSGRRRIKGNMDVEITVDVLEAAPLLDHILLFTGDGDFRRLVETCQRKGARVSIVSTLKASTPMVSDDLRRQANDFIELSSLKEMIGRDPSQRPVRTPVSDGDTDGGED